jgi:hypothetical protein
VTPAAASGAKGKASSGSDASKQVRQSGRNAQEAYTHLACSCW